MSLGTQPERLSLCVILWMQTRVDFPVADDDDGKNEAEQCGTDRDNAREADRFQHDIAKPGDFVPLNDLHYDGGAWRLHHSIVQQAK